MRIYSLERNSTRCSFKGMEVLFRYFTKLFSKQLKVRPIFDIFVTSEGTDETSHPYSLNRDLEHSLLPKDSLFKNINITF